MTAQKIMCVLALNCCMVGALMGGKERLDDRDPIQKARMLVKKYRKAKGPAREEAESNLRAYLTKLKKEHDAFYGAAEFEGESGDMLIAGPNMGEAAELSEAIVIMEKALPREEDMGKKYKGPKKMQKQKKSKKQHYDTESYA